MSDDLVKRLKRQAISRLFRSEELSDGTMVWHPMMLEAADEIERLRAELAAERENNKSFNKHLTRARGNTQTMKAERDALCAELAAEREVHKKTHDTMNEIIIENTELRAELYAAHKFNGMQRRENEELQEGLDATRAAHAVIRPAVIEECLDCANLPSGWLNSDQEKAVEGVRRRIRALATPAPAKEGNDGR